MTKLKSGLENDSHNRGGREGRKGGLNKGKRKNADDKDIE